MPSEAWREANQEKMRQYRRDWYRRNSDSSKTQASQNRELYRQRNKKFVDDIKIQSGCADCGRTDGIAECYEFDHVAGDKESTISALVRRPVSLERLQKEIAKCEIVCCWCHRIRTVKRYSSSSS